MTNPETADRRTQIRRVLAEADGFDFASLEPHDDYQQQADAILALFAPAAVSVPPPATRADDQAALRDRIAAAIWERQNPGRRYADCEYRWRADAEADADAVLAVLPEAADRADRVAVLAEVADWLKAWRPEFFERWAITEQERYEGGVDDAAAELRRMADEAQQPVGPCVAGEQPTAETPYPHTMLGAAELEEKPELNVPRLAGEALNAGEQQNETPEAATVHAVPLPGSNGISSCCGRPPCEFVGERVTRDPDKVTCPGPAAGVRQDGEHSE